MLTARTVAATMICDLATRMRVMSTTADEEMLRDLWRLDADHIEDVAVAVMSGDPSLVIESLRRLDTAPRERVAEAVPLPVWESVGVTWG